MSTYNLQSIEFGSEAYQTLVGCGCEDCDCENLVAIELEFQAQSGTGQKCALNTGCRHYEIIETVEVWTGGTTTYTTTISAGSSRQVTTLNGVTVGTGYVCSFSTGTSTVGTPVPPQISSTTTGTSAITDSALYSLVNTQVLHEPFVDDPDGITAVLFSDPLEGGCADPDRDYESVFVTYGRARALLDLTAFVGDTPPTSVVFTVGYEVYDDDGSSEVLVQNGTFILEHDASDPGKWRSDWFQPSSPAQGTTRLVDLITTNDQNQACLDRWQDDLDPFEE